MNQDSDKVQLVHLIIFCVSLQDTSKCQSFCRCPQACCAAQGNWNSSLSFSSSSSPSLLFSAKFCDTVSLQVGSEEESNGSRALVGQKDPFKPNGKHRRHLVWRTECKCLHACLPCSLTKCSRCVCLLTDNRLSAVREVRGLVGLRRPVVRDVGWAGEFRVFHARVRPRGVTAAGLLGQGHGMRPIPVGLP